MLGKRQTSDGRGSTTIRKSSRARSTVPPTLQSLTVSWGPGTNTANTLSFHVVTTAQLTGPSSSELKITQYVSDGLSIQAGTDPGHVQYRMTIFVEDQAESIATNTSTAIYDDRPGYTADYNLAGDTDLKYVFGAYWEVWLGTTLLTTTTPLYGTIAGAHPRTSTPAATVTATWNAGNNTWANQGTLVGAYPAWGAYPQPAIDNS